MNLLQIHEPGATPDPHAQEAELAIGIDLGTTNTVAAFATENGPEVLRASDGSALLPSVVHYRADGSVEVGMVAQGAALGDPGAVAVGQSNTSERWSVATRLISSGMRRLKLRKPASR